jgi:hypothetical protein
MKNVTGLLLNAWYDLLNGNISVPVYRTDAPPEEEGNFVLLRVESEVDNSNNQKFVTNPVIITEVVTKFKARIDDGLAIEIDSEIGELVKPTSATLALPVQTGIQVVDVRRENSTYLPEDDGTFRYNRIITRNIHRVLQTA